MSGSSETRAKVGDYQVDFVSGEVRGNGEVTRLKPQPCKVLRLLAERQGQLVLRDEIQREIWGGDTFVDFERGLNSCIKQIRSAFHDSADSPRYIETIPRRGYRCLAAVQPIENAAVLQTRAKLNPAGRVTWRSSAVAGFVTLVIAGLVLLGVQRSRQRTPEKIRLAVLPFANLSGDPGQEFLSDGLSEEMITQLGELAPQQLGVIARSSAAQYKQTTKSATQVGQELGVNYLLEGSVRREGNRLHVTAQLIQAADQSQLWASSYDREDAAMLNIETDMAQQVARSLALKLLSPSVSERVSPFSTNVAAHDAFLKGRFEMNRMTLEGFRAARTSFAEAVRQDPNFALAYAALAETWCLEPWWGGTSPREAFPQAREAVNHALRIDDQLAEGHTALGFIHLYYDWDFAAAESDFERAIQLEPGLALAHYWYAGVLSAEGRHQDAISAILRAQELDPLSPLINADIGWYYFYARRYDDALRQCQRTLEMYPSMGYGARCVMEAHLAKGMYAEAQADVTALIKTQGVPADQLPPASGAADAQSALLAMARWRLKRIDSLGRTAYISPYEIAVVHVRLGEKEQAFLDLVRAREERDSWLVLLDVDPRLDPLRSDPRFSKLRSEPTARL